MKKIILAGGGDENQSKIIDDFFVSLLPDNPKVLYIPTAWQLGTYESCLEWFSGVFNSRGISDITMWSELSGKDYADLSDFDAIYIGGGNTLSLLHHLKQSGFISILMEFIHSGRVVMGGSAGAIVLGKSIETASMGLDSDKNSVGIDDLSGLNLAEDKLIQCHYETNQLQEHKEFANKNGVSILAIPEESAVYIEEESMRALGSVSAYLIGSDGSVRELKSN